MAIQIKVRVAPRSRRNEISGELPDGTLKIRLTAAPTDGKANAALLKFLSEVWGVAKSKLRIIRGQTSRLKTISIDERQ